MRLLRFPTAVSGVAAVLFAFTHAAAVHSAGNVSTFALEADPGDGNLWKRVPYPPISQSKWVEAVNEGCSLIAAMGSRDSVAVTYFPGRTGSIQSPFVNYPADLTSWGYTVNGGDIADFRMGAGPGLQHMTRALNINWRRDDEGGPVVPAAWKHTTQTVHDGVTYPATNAVFSSLINVDDGVLVGWQKFGPAYMARMYQIPTVPRLKNWGEVVFLDWMEVARRRQKDISNIKYIVSADIANAETGQILQRILGVNDVKANCRRFYRWNRRREFNMDTEEGRALLSSPNGRGAAIFLIMHKNTFGEKTTISKVTVWCGYVSSYEVHMMFTVQKQPDDEDEEMEGAEGNPDGWGDFQQ